MGSTTRGQVRCRVPDMNIHPNALKRPRRSISQKSFEGRECLASHHIDPGHHSSASEDDGSPDVGHELHAVKRWLGKLRSTLGVSASIAISDRSGWVHLVTCQDSRRALCQCHEKARKSTHRLSCFIYAGEPLFQRLSWAPPFSLISSNWSS